MEGVCWRLLLALVLGRATRGSGGASSSGGRGSGGLSSALGALGTLGSGPLDAVVGPRLMARLVEGEAVRRVAEAAERECCGVTHDPTTTPLTRHYFDPASRAVCNDNSPAGFYFRRSKNSRRWIVFLEGGWYCFDRQSCEQRWHGLHPLMTSRGWPETRQVGGILSPDPEINPHWWTANHVFVPYCSSDSWSGTRYSAEGSGGFSFMGSVIVEEVIEALINLNLTHGHKLILAGSSAGGVGAMINVDRVAQQLIDRGIQAEVRAVSDSGWFLDNEPFAPLECLNAHSCPPVEAIRRGQELWQGRIPNSCLQEYPQHPWYCYFGYRAYPTMKSPLFVFQWVFDEAQMTADNVGKPISKEQWDYIHGIGERLRKTFENVTALFAPSCISHTVLTKRDWSNIKIGDVSLPQALYCWDVVPTTTLNTRSHQRENMTFGSPSSPSTASKDQNRVRHHNRQRHRSSRRREKGKERKKNRKNNTSSGERSQGEKSGRTRGEKTRRKHLVNRGENQTDAVQSSHLVLVQSDSDRNNSASVSESELSANDTTTDYKSSTRTKLAQANDRANRQGLSSPDIPHGEMLADSPGDSVSASSKTYLVESNAIETPQEEIQKKEPEETPKRKEKGGRGDARKTRRRNNKKRKGKSKKDRQRKRKRKERRRKQKERRRKQKEKRKKKRKRIKGVMKTKEIPGDRERTARSVFLLHNKQSALHQTQPVSAATVSLSLSNTALLSDVIVSPTLPVTSSFSTTPLPLHPAAATTKSSHQVNSAPVSSSSSSLVSTIVPSLTTHPGSQTSGEDSTTSNSNDAWTSDLCPAHSLHLTDHCAWPHCNYACPKLLNPFTGEEMNFIELLKSFGLDMASVANALGIDIHTLNSMGNDELLLILTQ